MIFKTKQEEFWVGDFGNEYSNRNQGDQLVNSNIYLFNQIFKTSLEIKSIVELGCNNGLNFKALKKINKNFELTGYEINKKALKEVTDLNLATVIEQSIIEPLPTNIQYDLSFTKGVLIHINPDNLHSAYENLYNLSKNYILVCEYYNVDPVTIDYRGHKKMMFKRDFAGEMIDKFKLKLIDYGFIYKRDNYSPNDDAHWFLLKK
jgi:pseudaminic acid biosynthesis-associated methylase